MECFWFFKVYFQQRHKPIPKSFRIFVIDSFHYAFNVYFETKQKSETDDFSQNYKILVPSELKQTNFRNFIPQVQLMVFAKLAQLGLKFFKISFPVLGQM